MSLFTKINTMNIVCNWQTCGDHLQWLMRLSIDNSSNSLTQSMQSLDNKFFFFCFCCYCCYYCFYQFKNLLFLNELLIFEIILFIKSHFISFMNQWFSMKKKKNIHPHCCFVYIFFFNTGFSYLSCDALRYRFKLNETRWTTHWNRINVQ